MLETYYINQLINYIAFYRIYCPIFLDWHNRPAWKILSGRSERAFRSIKLCDRHRVQKAAVEIMDFCILHDQDDRCFNSAYWWGLVAGIFQTMTLVANDEIELDFLNFLETSHQHLVGNHHDGEQGSLQKLNRSVLLKKNHKKINNCSINTFFSIKFYTWSTMKTLIRSLPSHRRNSLCQFCVRLDGEMINARWMVGRPLKGPWWSSVLENHSKSWFLSHY